ncbi:MAG: DUF3344 domain-containing protein [Candidatus Methanospirareceae archaeon]
MRKKQLALGIVIALVLVVVITPASADYNFSGWPLETRANCTVNGGVFIDYVPWDGSKDMSLASVVPNGTVQWAYLCTGFWGGTENYKGWVNVTFNGVSDPNGLGPIHLQGKDDTNPNVWCTTHGKYWLYYNVTDLVTAGAANTARARKINETYGAFDGRVYGIILVVIYEGGDDPKTIQFWLNDGNDALHYDAPVWPPVGEHNTGTAYFNGTVDRAHLTSAQLTMVFLTAYDPPCSTGVTFNGYSLDTSLVDSNTFELNSWNVTPYVSESENRAVYSRCEDTFINAPLAILTLEESPTAKPDLDTGLPERPYPSIAGIHRGTIAVTTNLTLNAISAYPCAGTGGHIEYVRIYGNGLDRSASWQGYQGDWHNLTFDGPFTLEKGKTYDYEIRTGSYPQLHHQAELPVAGRGIIRCTSFTDINGREHDKAIPAFKLYDDERQ